MKLFIEPAVDHDNIIATGLQWLETGQRIAIITLVNIEGNAPYPVGTQMLVAQNGDFIGQISGGCVEHAIAEQAKNVIAEGQNVTQRYGLDSPFFDIQLPCGSGIDAYIDVVSGVAELQSIQASLQAREAAKVTLNTEVGDFEKTYLPTPRLLIVGQGSIPSHLVNLAKLAGFEVISFSPPEMAPGHLLGSNPLPNLPQQRSNLITLCDASTALVSLFHEHHREIDILKIVLDSNLFYIGALGSKRTHQQRLEQLSSFGLSAQVLERIQGPVGLDIGASTPQQIAISILAQVIQALPGERD